MRKQETLDGSEYTPLTSDDWETPIEFYNLLNFDFHFTLDPCCQIETAKCERFFTKEDNGLKQSWAGHRVFMNPPYSDIESWCQKALMEVKNDCDLVVGLLPSWTDRSWFHAYIYPDYARVKFLRKRIKFLLNGKYAKSSPQWGSMLVIWTKETIFSNSINF